MRGAQHPGPGGDPLNKVPARFQKGHLATKDSIRRLEVDLLRRLARHPTTANDLASATLRGRVSIENALRRLEAAGKVQRTRGKAMGRGKGWAPTIWSVKEGADDGPAE